MMVSLIYSSLELNLVITVEMEKQGLHFANFSHNYYLSLKRRNLFGIVLGTYLVF